MDGALRHCRYYVAVLIISFWLTTIFGDNKVVASASAGGSIVCLKPITGHTAGLELLQERYPTSYSKLSQSNCWISRKNHDDDGVGGDGHNSSSNNNNNIEDDFVYIVDDEAHLKLNKLTEYIKSISNRSRIMIRMISSTALIPILDDNYPPKGKYAADHVDLSGVWKPIVTPQFKHNFNSYLINCSVSFFHRKLLLTGINHQTEYIVQRFQGEELEIIDKTTAGFSFDRILVSYKNVTIQDPHGDFVQVESWWEQEGLVHKSWLRGKPTIHGVIETSRYLEGNNILISESTFHPSSDSSSSYNYAEIVFRFQRME